MDKYEHDPDEHFPRRLLEHEGTNGVTHMLADAIEKWGKDMTEEGHDSYCSEYANRLRELADKF